MKLCRTILSVSAVAVFIGCSSNPVSEKNDPGTDPENVFEQVEVSVIKSDTSMENVDIPQEQLDVQAATNSEFAVKMYQLLAEDGKNLFFSSHSIINALAMIAAGAKGETQVQMRTAMQVSLEGNKFDEAVNGINFSLSEHSQATDGITLNTVNTTWAPNEMVFAGGYLDHLALYYNSGVNVIDFFNNPEGSRRAINSWVEEQTNSCIKDLLPQGSITRSTKLVLTNAIYFLGEWLHGFNEDDTKPAPFYLADGSNVEVPFMNSECLGSGESMDYAKVGDVEVLDLPYKGERLSMTFMLPAEGKFSDFESSLSLEKVNEMIDSLKTTKGTVIIPKFKITYGAKSIKDELISLGMKLPFLNKADFSGITEDDTIAVDDIIHKAFVAVDEKGTEAAAATGIFLKFTSTIYRLEYPVFEASRPFVFVIRDNLTGTMLFMGKVCNPSIE